MYTLYRGDEGYSCATRECDYEVKVIYKLEEQVISICTGNSAEGKMKSLTCSVENHRLTNIPKGQGIISISK